MQKEIQSIEGLIRIEDVAKEEMFGHLSERTHSVYPHDEIYGDYCPIQIYVDCPPEKVFEYMKHTRSLEEWTYSVRDLEPTEHHTGTLVGRDAIGDNTSIFCKTESNKEALTVDYHCAWDQGDTLWMIYLNRLVPAEMVLGKPGTVIFWQNCRHPWYDNNPHASTAPDGRPWVGEFWDLFFAGHTIEFENLKRILEHRHKNSLPMGPHVEGVLS